MTSVSQLIGLSDDITHPLSVYPTILEDPRVNPDAYPSLANAAKAIGVDVRVAYADACLAKEREERQQDRRYLHRAREYVELNEQVDASTVLLTDLAKFLSTFQSDLSAVSGHISELQTRSKTIEERLASRKAVERTLSPLLSSIALPPSLIKLIVETEVSPEWVPAVVELNSKLGAIRSGPRVASRKPLDDAAEALRVTASQKILHHFLNLLKPFTISLAPSLSALQQEHLIPLKPLFDFLWQHSARQAHEFQKAYVSTARWYYETSFRRYVRALEGARVRIATIAKPDVIGNVVVNSQASLALLAKKNRGASEPSPSAASTSIAYSDVDGPPVLSAHAAADSSLKPVAEAIFRSVALVLTDTASTEHAFLSSFFGSHASIPSPAPSAPSTPHLGRTLTSPATPDRASRNAQEDEDGSDSGRISLSPSTVSTAATATPEERNHRMRVSVVDGLWKSILEPAQEYARNLVTAMLDPSPSPVSLLAMIRLNEILISSLIDTQTCQPLESYLLFVRMTLWPAFVKNMHVQIESVQHLHEGKGTKWGGGAPKDSTVQIIALRYAELFNAAVALSREQDEEIVFSNILRLRQELDKLLVTQSAKISDAGKRKAFLSTHYEELLQSLSSGLSTHPRSQAEAAHYRESVRKLG